MKLVDYLAGNFPPHIINDGTKYHCPCTQCCEWRQNRVTPGSFCKPATNDPSRIIPGTTSAWSIGAKPSWEFRLEPNGIFSVTVIGFLNRSLHYSHVMRPTVVVLTHEKGPRILEMYAADLVVL